ncbi:MAG: hypothetical protein Q9M37_01220 [Desulfonauticus sp.]|nr:hypothetical protein [Desulfonauticus sp.]
MEKLKGVHGTTLSRAKKLNIMALSLQVAELEKEFIFGQDIKHGIWGYVGTNNVWQIRNMKMTKTKDVP